MVTKVSYTQASKVIISIIVIRMAIMSIPGVIHCSRMAGQPDLTVSRAKAFPSAIP